MFFTLQVIEFNVLVGDWYTKSHTTLKKLLDSGRSLAGPMVSSSMAKTQKAMARTRNGRISHRQNNYDSLDIHVGQRFTVLVTANKEPMDYYLVASTRFYKSTVTSKVVIRYKNGKGHASPELPKAPVDWACSLNHFHPNPQGSYKYGSIPINMTIKLQLDGLAGKLR
ncbi:L-ascorbate oxidase-like protein [Senna tora]|uniref:L-ascorbate oxidase-like protein n=1 Tax=Senna tora TaxID=362788 RepID=A0A834TQW8_9FABA|nr:L-ascorbate oxidase-like protein [Senna tora]